MQAALFYHPHHLSFFYFFHVELTKPSVVQNPEIKRTFQPSFLTPTGQTTDPSAVTKVNPVLRIQKSICGKATACV